MEKYYGMVCPFCQKELSEGDEIISCEACQTPHHKSCWDENNGCSAQGCLVQNTAQAEENKETSSKPQEDGQENEAFAPIIKFCSRCGRKLEDNQRFCSKCGLNTDMTMQQNPIAATQQKNGLLTAIKTKPYVKVIIISIALLLAIVASTTYLYSQYAKAKQYVSDANEFCDLYLTAGVNLEDIANKVKDNWYTYVYDNGIYIQIYDSVDDAISSALLFKADEVTDAQIHKYRLEGLYAKLKKAPSKSDSLIEIQDAVKQAYDTYIDFYYCATSPTGNYSTFTSKFNDHDEKLVKYYNILRNILNE